MTTFFAIVGVLCMWPLAVSLLDKYDSIHGEKYMRDWIAKRYADGIKLRGVAVLAILGWVPFSLMVAL